jgi:DNA-binding response OmpR family regulator
MSEEINRQKPKILLLEDYPDFLEFYKNRLKEAGFVVTVESDEDHGLQSAIADKPDLIVLDISLPQAEDFGFIKEIKKRPELADVPVVVLTDLSSQESIDEGLAAGASEYFVRDDFTFAQVIDKIKEVIEKQLKNKN